MKLSTVFITFRRYGPSNPSLLVLSSLQQPQERAYVCVALELKRILGALAFCLYCMYCMLRLVRPPAAFAHMGEALFSWQRRMNGDIHELIARICKSYNYIFGGALHSSFYSINGSC